MLTLYSGVQLHNCLRVIKKNGFEVLVQGTFPVYLIIFQRPYCFELGNLCYTWHSPQTGQMYQVLRMGLVKCVDDHTANL